MEWTTLAVNDVMQQQTARFHHCWEGVILSACVRFMFGETSLALVFFFAFVF